MIEQPPFIRNSWAQAESTTEDNLADGHDEEHRADERVQAEERDVDPVEASSFGDEMFQHDAQHDDDPSDDEGEPESAQHPEGKQQAAHNHVSEECGLQSVLRPPGNYQRMEALFAVEFIILQGVDNVETNQPQNHRERKHDHLQNFQ